MYTNAPQSGWDDKPQVIGFGQKRATVTKGSALSAAQRAGTVSSTSSKGATQSKGGEYYCRA
jgi:hypothetical protein